MYKVQPSDAMNEMYGINRADAQVFDNRQLQDRLYKKQDQDVSERKAKEEKLSGLMSDVSKIGKGEIRPADIDYFSGEQKALYDDVKKAFSESRGGALPIEKQVDFESRIADIQRKALISGSRHKQNMSEYQKAVLHPNKYTRADEVARIQADSFDKANAGKFNEPLTTLTENFDYGQYVNDKLAPWAAEQAKRRDNRGVYSNTPEERTQMIIDDLADPVKLNQAQFDFDSANDKLGTNNPIDYYVKKYADKLTVDVKPKQSEWEVYGGGGNTDKSSVRVTHTTKDDSEEYSVQDPKTNEEIVVIKKDGKIVGGIKGGRLTPTEKSERDKALADNSKAKQTFEREVNALKKRAVEEGLTPEEVAAEMPKKPSWYPLTVPHQEKGVEVDAVEAQKIAFNKYSVNVEDLANGKQSNIVVQPVDARTKNKVKPKLEY